MACELFAAKYRTFAGTIAGDFWAVATCLSALLAYLVQNWVHFQLIISLFGLLSIPLYWYYNFTSLMYYILLTLSILTIKIKSIAFLPARRYSSAVLAVIVCLSICPSVRPSRLSVTSRCSRRTKTCAKYQNPWRHIHKWLFRYTLCSTFRHLHCPDLVCPKNSACSRPMPDGNTGGFPVWNFSQAFICLTSMVGLCWSPRQTMFIVFFDEVPGLVAIRLI